MTTYGVEGMDWEPSSPVSARGTRPGALARERTTEYHTESSSRLVRAAAYAVREAVNVIGTPAAPQSPGVVSWLGTFVFQDGRQLQHSPGQTLQLLQRRRGMEQAAVMYGVGSRSTKNNTEQYSVLLCLYGVHVCTYDTRYLPPCGVRSSQASRQLQCSRVRPSIHDPRAYQWCVCLCCARAYYSSCAVHSDRLEIGRPPGRLQILAALPPCEPRNRGSRGTIVALSSALQATCWFSRHFLRARVGEPW